MCDLLMEHEQNKYSFTTIGSNPAQVEDKKIMTERVQLRE